MNEPLSAWEVLDRFLATESQDAGCAEAFEMLDVWAELVQQGGDPEQHLPRVAAHLRACRPCFEDLTGLLGAMTQLRAGPPGRSAGRSAQPRSAGRRHDVHPDERTAP